MAVYTTIDNPAEYFNVKLYSGSGSNTTVAHGLSGNAPDMFVIKRRNSTGGWINWNSGLTNNSYYMQWNNTDQQDNSTNNLQNTATTTTNISIGDQAFTNASGGTYVLYSWKESATAGFDIVSYTGTGSARTVSHSLSAVPNWMIVKNIETGGKSWVVYHSANTSAPETEYLLLDSNGATADFAGYFNDTAPTSSVFTVGTGSDANASSDDFIAYLWRSVQGYSKFGSFIGNSNASTGTFTYLGFRPSLVIIKGTSSSRWWSLQDDKRSPFNLIGDVLFANTNGAEETNNSNYYIDFLSNGFKIRGSSVYTNNSGETYLYMAFAEAPFVNSKGVPTTAR
jgi:hypothetical protein